MKKIAIKWFIMRVWFSLEAFCKTLVPDVHEITQAFSPEGITIRTYIHIDRRKQLFIAE